MVLWRCVPCLLVAFLLCSRCVGLKYGFISRFNGVFSGFLLLDVCLYCLRALRGLWGFCVREMFGGFMACGVFPAKSFLLSFRFPLLSCFRPALLLCFVACFLSCSLGLCCCFFFPFGLYVQKERAQFLASSLVLLWACLVVQILVTLSKNSVAVALAFSSSSGW